MGAMRIREPGPGDVPALAEFLASLEAAALRLSLLNLRERESYRRGFYAKRGWTERPGAANLIKRLEP